MQTFFEIYTTTVMTALFIVWTNQGWYNKLIKLVLMVGSVCGLNLVFK